MIKKYLKCLGYLVGMIIVLTLILSLINYFIKLPTNMIKIIIPLISMLIASFILGKNTKEKAYLEGIKFAGVYIAMTITLKLIFNTSFNYKVIIDYISLLITGIIGAMIGINVKRG